MSILKVNSLEPAKKGNETYFVSRAWGSVGFGNNIQLFNDGNVSSVVDMGANKIRVSFRDSLAKPQYAAVCQNSNSQLKKLTSNTTVAINNVDDVADFMVAL